MARRLSAVAILICILLCGCGSSRKEFSCRDIKISLSPQFVDKSQTTEGKNFTFLYVSDKIGIAGVQDAKSKVQVHYPDMTLEQYAQFTAAAAGLDVPVRQRDGVYTYTYTASYDDQEYTYITASYESNFSFWLLSGYCPSQSYKELELEIWQYLMSVTCD